MTTSEATDVLRCAQRIGEAVDFVFAGLAELDSRVRSCWERAQAETGEVKKADLEALRPTIHASLRAPGNHFCGTGVVVAPGALADAQLHLEWWQRRPENRLERLQLDFSPASEDFYDYRQMPWFAEPRDERRGVVFGPYVDLNGADLYILTFTRPVVVGDEFVGVVGADMPLGSFERLLLPPLKHVAGDALVATHEGRVLAANTPLWTPGSLARNLLQNKYTSDVDRVVINVPEVEWSVLRVRAS
ncbi:PDC sensor domain-containing protein [Amycolatopsis sp. H6(2020)]|nr:PDC sensor domain-containing protein [Amycolatopsis sp. H6(2020)]